MTNFIVQRIPVARSAVISSRPAGPAYKPQGVGRTRKAVVGAVGLAAAARIARDRRTYERMILVAIVLASAAGAARAGQASLIERLIAWDKHQAQAVKRQVKAARSKKS
jgi:hypothetical protein